MLAIRTGFEPRSSSARKLLFISIRTLNCSPSVRAAPGGDTKENSTVRLGANLPDAGTHWKPSPRPTEAPTIPRSRSTPLAPARGDSRPSELQLDAYCPGRNEELT